MPRDSPGIVHRVLRSRVSGWLGVVAGAAVIGGGYAAATGGTPVVGATVGATIGGTVYGFESFYVRSAAGAWLRRLPLTVFMVATTTVWLVLIASALQFVPPALEGDSGVADGGEERFGGDFLFSLMVSTAFNFVLRVRELIGGRVLGNFLLGRYYRPLRERRIFMFLDLADSTHLAERLGDIEAQELIRQFFFDIATPIAACGGETHRFIGDEVVVTWALGSPRDNGRCVRCAFDVQALMEQRADIYQARFGTVPRFRVGLHGGPVVASEVGDDKREIVYFGDTVNTAARLEALCKEHSREVLISGVLLEQLVLPTGVLTQDLGEVRVRGKEGALRVFALSRDNGSS